jgi:hypothetical protein
VATFVLHHHHAPGFLGANLKFWEFKGHRNQSPKTREVQRKPSSVYWACIRQFGLIQTNLCHSRECTRHSFFRLEWGVNTLLYLLGLDHEQLTYRYAGRDFRLTDVHGSVVKEIMS